MPIQPKPAQKIAYATLLLNFSVACAKKNTNVDMKLVILDTLNTKIGNSQKKTFETRFLIHLNKMIPFRPTRNRPKSINPFTRCNGNLSSSGELLNFETESKLNSGFNRESSARKYGRHARTVTYTK